MTDLVFPKYDEVIALALQSDIRVPLVELKDMHTRQAFSASVVKALWPKAKARKTAFLMGQKTYIGKICEKHPCSRRYTYCTHCIKCAVGHSRKHYVNNQQKVINRSRKWRENNKEYIKLFNKAKWQIKKSKRSNVFL